MASLYKKNRIWYVSTFVNGKRISKSLQTKQRKTAFAKMPSTLSNLLKQSNHLNREAAPIHNILSSINKIIET